MISSTADVFSRQAPWLFLPWDSTWWLLPCSKLHGGRSHGKQQEAYFIFLQGGNDGINTILPRGDAMYNTTTRPTLFIPEGEALDSGNGFAQLHPALSPIGEVYNHSSINGLNGAGNMAFLHRIGYDGQSRSHFDSRRFWQNGIPGDADTEGASCIVVSMLLMT